MAIWDKLSIIFRATPFDITGATDYVGGRNLTAGNVLTVDANGRWTQSTIPTLTSTPSYNSLTVTNSLVAGGVSTSVVVGGGLYANDSVTALGSVIANAMSATNVQGNTLTALASVNAVGASLGNVYGNNVTLSQSLFASGVQGSNAIVGSSVFAAGVQASNQVLSGSLYLVGAQASNIIAANSVVATGLSAGTQYGNWNYSATGLSVGNKIVVASGGSFGAFAVATLVGQQASIGAALTTNLTSANVWNSANLAQYIDSTNQAVNKLNTALAALGWVA